MSSPPGLAMHAPRMGSACAGPPCLLLLLACLTCLRGASAQLGLNEPRVEAAHLYGNINKYAYYFTDLMIGSPNPQRTSVIVDTGSRLVGFPCKQCEHCGDHLDPAFDFRASESARWLKCGVDCATGCSADSEHCSYRETYSEGSTIAGRWFDDFVEIDDVHHANPPVHARMGCHMNENKLFYTQRANGIMGLAPSAGDMEPADTAARPTILQDLFRDKTNVRTEVFSICLATWGGRLTVGGYNNSYHKETVQWMDMNPSHYYFVFPEGIFVDAVPPASPSRGADFGIAIIDSGTTYTYFPPLIYDDLTAQLNGFCNARDGCGATPEGAECFRLRDLTTDPVLFPTLRIKFRGDTDSVAWPPTSYLHQRGEQGVWCQTFMKNNLNQTVFGISWMLHKDVIFDLQERRLGVVSANCPEHRTEAELQEKDELPLSAAFEATEEAVQGLAAQRSARIFVALGCISLIAAIGVTSWVVRSTAGRRRPRKSVVDPKMETALRPTEEELRLCNPTLM